MCVCFLFCFLFCFVFFLFCFFFLCFFFFFFFFFFWGGGGGGLTKIRTYREEATIFESHRSKFELFVCLFEQIAIPIVRTGNSNFVVEIIAVLCLKNIVYKPLFK